MADPARARRPPREKPQQIADELRRLIVAGELSEGDSLGHEPELVERFGVSRPSLREALRILEAEGLITVVRGVLGGVVVHEPSERMTARTTALVLQARNVSVADVHDARRLLEENRDKVEAMTAALLEWETIDADQINDIMDGKPPRPPKPSSAPPVTKSDSGNAGPAPTAAAPA